MDGLRAKYLVLKPSGTDAYAVASRKAMQTYALALAGENDQFAKDLLDWVKLEEDQAGKIKTDAEKLAEAHDLIGDLSRMPYTPYESGSAAQSLVSRALKIMEDA